MSDAGTRAEVEARLQKPFDEVREQLVELFEQEWDEVEIVIETSATKSERTAAEVIVDLIARAERKPAPATRIRRSVIRWIGKPWRERENPWDRFKDRVPPPPPRTDTKADDLEEWTPPQPES